MSSSAYLEVDPDSEPIFIQDFMDFAQENGIEFSRNTIGQSTFYQGEVRIVFGDDDGVLPTDPATGRLLFDQATPPASARKLTIGSYFYQNLAQAAELTLRAWKRWPSMALAASPEIVHAIARTSVRDV